MSGYDPDDGDGYGTARTIGAALVGGAAGRTLGKALGGKVGKFAANGSRTAKQLRAAKLANASTAVGAGGAATLTNLDNESVRDTLNRVIEAKEAAANSGAVPYAFPLATAAILGRGVYKNKGTWKKLGKQIAAGPEMQGIKKPMSSNELKKFVKSNAKYMGAAGAVGATGRIAFPIKHGDDQ